MAEKIDLSSVAYVLGILSIVFAFFNPTAGLVFGIIGMVKSKKHGFEKAKKLNRIGIILSIIFAIISLLFTIFATKLGVNTSGSFPGF